MWTEKLSNVANDMWYVNCTDICTHACTDKINTLMWGSLTLAQLLGYRIWFTGPLKGIP